MLPPPVPADEAQRISTLHGLNILDTMPEERFDRITRLAQRIFQTETALISLVDTNRQWFKARCGLDATETGRDISFCGHAILSPGVMVIEDARQDSRFFDNPLVTGAPFIRFYAGQPLSAPNETRLGTLCLLDPAPRTFSEHDKQSLRDLASIVEDELRSSMLVNGDALTGLANRRGFSAAATRLLARHQQAALLYLDLDGFKAINDTFGHKVGDDALRLFARVLQASCGPEDIPARMGGDEFCVLTVGPAAHCQAMVARIRRQLADICPHALPAMIRFSAGSVPFVPSRHTQLSDLMIDGDVVMYAEKRRRKQARAS